MSIDEKIKLGFFDWREKIYNDVCSGFPITLINSKCEHEKTASVESMFVLYDKYIKMQSEIKTPYALVMNPYTFKKLEPKLWAMKSPVEELSIYHKFNGIKLYTSSNVANDIVKIAWNHDELVKILNEEDK